MDKLNETNTNELNKNNFDNQIETDFIDAYIKMIKEHKINLNKKILNIISKEIDNIEKNKVEILIDKYLTTELEYNGLYTINELSKELDELSDSIIIKIEKEIYNKEKCFQIYKNEVTRTLHRNEMEWINTLTENFTEYFINRLQIYLENLNSPSIESLSSKLNNIQTNIADILFEYKKEFNESYQNILKEYISNKLNQMKKTISETKITSFEIPKLEKYSPIMSLSNYELINDNNIFYARNKETNEKLELIFDGIRLKSRDNKINFIVDESNPHQGYINNENDIRIVLHDGLITLVLPSHMNDSKKEKNIISFTKVDHNYKFYYNLKPTKNIKKIQAMIKLISIYAPGIYDKLIYDLDFGSVLIDIQKYYRQKNLQAENNEQPEMPNNNKPSR